MTTVEALRCTGCEKIFTEDDSPGRLYECSTDGTFRQDDTENQNHQCPDCKKFGAKLSEFSCPDGCTDEVEEIEALVDPDTGEYHADEESLAEAIEERKPENVSKKQKADAERDARNAANEKRWAAAREAKWARRDEMLVTIKRVKDIVPVGLMDGKRTGFTASIHDSLRDDRDSSVDYGETFMGWHWEEIYFLICLAIGETPDPRLLVEGEVEKA